jgi:hypothetical protein
LVLLFGFSFLLKNGRQYLCFLSFSKIKTGIRPQQLFWLTLPNIGGVATIENVSSGQTVSYTFSNEASEGSLCEYNAEWIIEDFEEGSSLVQFADFGTVTFTGASATDGSGTVGVSGAEIIDIEQNNKVLTSCSTSGSNEVSCTYT